MTWPRPRSIGAYTGLYYFASSAAAITGPIVSGWLIDWTSYRDHLAVTAVFLALAVVFMVLVRPAKATEAALESGVGRVEG